MNDLELLDLAEKPDTTSRNPLQGGADWLQARIGCLTASRFADAIDTLKSGKPSKSCTDYMMELVAERMIGNAMPHYVTPAMQWGIENEPGARLAYERATGTQTQPASFVLHPIIPRCGASPDGFVGDAGLVEFKCPNTTTFLKWVLSGVVPAEHKPQMLLQLACTGRQWCDFVAFDPRIKTTGNLFVRRFEPSAAEIQQAESQVAAFLTEVDQLEAQVMA